MTYLEACGAVFLTSLMTVFSYGGTVGNGVRVAGGTTGVVVKDKTFNVDRTNSMEFAAVFYSGSDGTVSGIRQLGTADLFRFDGAKNVVADLLDGTSGNFTKHGMYCGGPKVTEGITIKRFYINMIKGTHGVRLHNHKDILLGDESLSWPGKEFAFVILDRSPYAGCALSVRDGVNFRAVRGQINGCMGVGPLPITAEERPPGWEKLREDGFLLDRCEINGDPTPGAGYPLRLGAGVLRVRVVKCVVRDARDREPLTIDGAMGPNGEWPVASGEFVDTQFFCTKGDFLTPRSNAKYLINFVFTRCTLNGKPLGLHGEIN